jgi:hypothetical protein
LDLLPKESREKYACSAGGIQEMDMMEKKCQQIMEDVGLAY